MNHSWVAALVLSIAATLVTETVTVSAPSSIPPARSAQQSSRENFDENDTEVTYPGTNQPELAAAYGWLRVSHRELDPQKTTRWRPVHRHAVLQKLEPGEVVSVEVEVLPTSIVLERGHRLVLEVAAEDDPRIFPFTHTDPEDRQTAGTHTVYTGGQYDSHVLLPIIPPASSGP